MIDRINKHDVKNHRITYHKHVINVIETSRRKIIKIILEKEPEYDADDIYAL